MIDLLLINIYMICFACCIGVYAVVLVFPKSSFFQKLLHIMVIITACAAIGALGVRYVFVYYPNIFYRKFLPVNTLWEGLLFFNAIMLLVCLAEHFYKRFRLLFALSMLVIICANIVILKTPKSIVIISPLYQTWWMSSYAVSSITGYAVLAFGFLAGLLYMFRYAAGRLFNREHAILKHISQLNVLEALHTRFIFAGFPLITVGIMLRSCWANAAWGRWWLWNNEDIFSLIAWILYVLYFHMHERSRLSKKTFVLISIIAYSVGFISYFFGWNIGFNAYKNF